ncbi:YceH family protein [Psychromonas sp. KJ10-10]|uniref:YceH family protein n=1 Tax=Psychromonas sp. KJ10-10 TaxID=3391823 RepID=UPI0039B3D990
MITLTALQNRIIGVMLEKEVTTPEQYPLSLNALTNGCNQKSNREPVMQLSETEVQNVIDELIDMKQLMVDSSASGRVNKYKHRFCNTPFSSLQLTDQQKSIICMLFLRGPQTPGELRTRTNRLANFSNVNEVEETLEQLQNLNNSQLVKKLAREPGKRDSRYIHLFSDISEIETATTSSSINTSNDTVCIRNTSRIFGARS